MENINILSLLCSILSLLCLTGIVICIFHIIHFSCGTSNDLDSKKDKIHYKLPEVSKYGFEDNNEYFRDMSFLFAFIMLIVAIFIPSSNKHYDSAMAFASLSGAFLYWIILNFIRFNSKKNAYGCMWMIYIVAFFIFIPIVYQTPEKYKEDEIKKIAHQLKKATKLEECLRAKDECNALFYSIDRDRCEYRVRKTICKGI